MRSPKLLVTTSPFIRQGATTPSLMGDVLLALLPVVAIATWFFGVSALVVVAAATAGAVGIEWLWGRKVPLARLRRDGSDGTSPVRDNSALLTGVILGLILPPGLPLWMAFLGGAVGVGLGKLVWGGLGHNLFNPALVGRAFLQAAFPTALTTWTVPAGLPGWRWSNFAWPFMQGRVDGVTGATPLGVMKFAKESTPYEDLLRGSIGGSLGETSAAVILICGLWLVWRRACDWRIPVSILGTVTALSGVIWAIAPERYPSPVFMLLSGGLTFGAVFMATDPVSSPLAPLGTWIYGAGIGVLVVLIRLWGGLPEGVMYAILLMNAATPLIDKIGQPRVFGRTRSKAA